MEFTFWNTFSFCRPFKCFLDMNLLFIDAPMYVYHMIPSSLFLPHTSSLLQLAGSQDSKHNSNYLVMIVSMITMN
jgi:hypothetical protein